MYCRDCFAEDEAQGHCADPFKSESHEGGYERRFLVIEQYPLQVQNLSVGHTASLFLARLHPSLPPFIFHSLSQVRPAGTDTPEQIGRKRQRSEFLLGIRAHFLSCMQIIQLPLHITQLRSSARKLSDVMY